MAGASDAVDFLPITPHPEQIDLEVKLRPFITDWQYAQQHFLVGITARLADLCQIRPNDLSVNSSTSLGGVSCICRIFGGAASITLAADALKLSFANVRPDAYPVVFDTIRRSSDLMHSDFADHELAWFSLYSTQDMVVASANSIDAYLHRFAQRETIAALENEPGITYQPSPRITLAERGRFWKLHRSVEKSTLSSDKLFVTTSIFMPITEITTFGSLEKLVQKLYAIADRAVGLRREDR